jgi:hypothetical protein
MSKRVWLFVIIVATCVVGAGIYVLRAGRAGHATPTDSPVLSSVLQPTPMVPLEQLPLAEGPFLVFSRQAGTPDGRDGSLGIVPLSDLASPRFEEKLRCDRVHMSGGRGICLERRGRFPIQYVAVTFDASFKPTGEFPIAGAPSRAQVSVHGSYAGITAFVTGHSYAEMGFSTRASILDLKTGRWVVEDLETLTVRRDGRRFSSVDFNFWGVTFTADEHEFYATLGTGGGTYLVHGRVGSPVMDVVDEAVECPSLSPDNRRIAFKQRTARGVGPTIWQIGVLDIATHQRHAVAETRGIDDQVQWLDDAHLLYALPGTKPAVMDTWTVPADGSGKPELFLPMSYSAVPVRQ